MPRILATLHQMQSMERIYVESRRELASALGLKSVEEIDHDPARQRVVHWRAYVGERDLLDLLGFHNHGVPELRIVTGPHDGE